MIRHTLKKNKKKTVKSNKKKYGEYHEKMCFEVNEFNLHLKPHQFLFVSVLNFDLFSMYSDNFNITYI